VDKIYMFGYFGECLPPFRCKAYHPFKDVKAV
jgi:hypothetical protein